MSDKIELTEFNKRMLNSVPKSRRKQAYGQGFDCEYIDFKKEVNTFECIDIADYIYEGVV